MTGTVSDRLPLRPENVSSPGAERIENSALTKPARSARLVPEIHWLSVRSSSAAPRETESARVKSVPSTTQLNGSC